MDLVRYNRLILHTGRRVHLVQVRLQEETRRRPGEGRGQELAEHPRQRRSGGASSAWASCSSAGPPSRSSTSGRCLRPRADTVATELGLLNRTPPRLITASQDHVSPGHIGRRDRVSDFWAASLASLAIGSIAAALGILRSLSPALVVLAAVAGGLSGSVADSIIGATVQRKGVCSVCGEPSENLVHCGKPTKCQSGFAYVDNNVVNLLAT